VGRKTEPADGIHGYFFRQSQQIDLGWTGWALMAEFGNKMFVLCCVQEEKIGFHG
jgi:hypothetical protein